MLTSMLVFQKTDHLSLFMKKQDTNPTEMHSTDTTWKLFFKSLKVRKDKERPRNSLRLEKTEKAGCPNAMWYPSLDPGMEKDPFS